MLKPAQLYRTEIQAKFAAHMYDVEYQYYNGGSGVAVPEVGDNNYNSHFFASVDGAGAVIGIIDYKVDRVTRNCYGMGIASFKFGNITFLRDVMSAVDDVFCKYGFNRLEFTCYADNPVLRSYRRFVKKHGGHEIGTRHQCGMTMDGRLQDLVLFEILREDYVK